MQGSPVAERQDRPSQGVVCDASGGIVHQFRGEDGVDNWSGPLNFPTPEKTHNRITIASPEGLAPSGRASIKVEIKPGDPQWSEDSGKGPKRRAEFSWNDWKFEGGKEGWVGAAFYLPSDPMEDNNGTAIFQLHNFPEKGTLWNLFTWDGRLRSTNDPLGDLMDVDITPYLDRWTRMVVNFKPSTKTDGFIRMWLDDELVVDRTGITKESGSEGPYLKHGLYFWGYDKFDDQKHAVAYFDNLRIGDETSSYGSVNPACW
ncbi:MAG: heparin lyase I family protein [Pseudomonadota bacterium]